METYVTYKVFFTTMGLILTGAAGVAAFIFNIHVSQPHPGALTEKQYTIESTRLREDIIDRLERLDTDVQGLQKYLLQEKRPSSLSGEYP